MFGKSWKPRYHYQAAVRGSYGPREAEEIMGLGLKCQGIHVPDNPSPRTIKPSGARAFWDKAMKSAKDYYGSKDTAANTAWRALRTFYTKEGGKWVRRQGSRVLLDPSRMPSRAVGDPGDLVTLGVILEYTLLDADANLVVRRFPDADPPKLYWQHDTKVLWVFPGTGMEECSNPQSSPEAAKLFKRWAQRNAECRQVIDVPATTVTLDGMADTVVYRSDKWHGRNHDQLRMPGSQEYIHQFGQGVGVWQDHGNPPSAICFQGGCLDMEERGIIH